MGISLQKGGNLSLNKSAPGMTKIQVGLGWASRTTAGDDYDLDASAFIVNESGKVRGDHDFIFYNQLKSKCGSIEHTGDDLTGGGGGDDETLLVDLTKIPPDVNKIVFGVTIDKADIKNQNFGQVSDAFIRIVNSDNNEEVVRFDLSEDYSVETAMVFGELYRRGSEWKFKAIGQGYAGGLRAMALQFGVDVS
jgi:tellurium resistance protein TerD